VLTGVKKRHLSGDIKNSSLTGSKYSLFNYDNVVFDSPIVICEGELDAMIIHQSGYKNVLSIGCGANSLSSMFEINEDFLKKFNEIILFTDNDKYGDEMDAKFLDRFQGNVSTVDKSLYLDEKDANDIYIKHGKEQILKIINSGKVSFDGEWDLTKEEYVELDSTGISFIETGIKTLDYSINTLQTKTVSLITGRSNAGKSTFVNQIISNAIDDGHKCYLVAGEGEKNKIINKIYMSVIGNDSRYYKIKKFGLRDIKEPTVEATKALNEWHKNKLTLFVKSLSKYKSEDQLFNMLEYKIRTEHYKLIILDNLMSLLEVSSSTNKNEKQAMFIEKCHHLAKSCNCAIVVVLHPNKTYKAGEEMDFEQISGTSDIANKADTIINVIRVKDPVDNVTCKIQVLKNRDWSELPVINCVYDYTTNTYAEVFEGRIKRKEVKEWKSFLPKQGELCV
jgi:DNA primase